MKKKQNLRVLFSCLLAIFIVFPVIFFPVYYRPKKSLIEEYAILQINTIECTDKLQNGSYKLKISIVNRFPFTEYPIQIQGSQYESYGMNTTISKKITNLLELSKEDVMVFLKLKKGLRSETVNFQINSNGSLYTWSNDFWFEKFGGSIRINYRFIFVW